MPALCLLCRDGQPGRTAADEITVYPEAAAALSPYRTTHLKRLGHDTLDVTHVPLPLEYDLPIFTSGSQ